jgi:2-dehydro-3-deoxyphosphooctonate aldolase (KDO 8-P synthase)
MTETQTVAVGGVTIGTGNPLALIAGPCVVESRESCMTTARQLAELAENEGIPLIFKASYDKANRTSVSAFRGLGIDDGLQILAEVKAEFGLPILTDIHSAEEADRAAEVADVIQIPAFLCRQTDLLAAAAKTGKAVNIKKGQFLAPRDVRNAVDKVVSSGNDSVLLTERGTSFGYNNLVVDMRSIPIMRELGRPVVFDATHSVQLPGGDGDKSGGDSRWVPFLARAAVAAGCDAVFAETHHSPADALCDAANTVSVQVLGELWPVLRSIDETVGR